MTDILNSKIFEHAKGALAEQSSETSEQKYNELIDELETLFGKNHKEVAAELQRIAKAIEDEGDQEASFAFKQRTCEVMLKRNMEQRILMRAARAESHPNEPPASMEASRAPSSVVRRLVGGCELVCIPCHTMTATADFYKKVLQANQLFEHLAGTHVIGLRVAAGPIMLLMDTQAFTNVQPVFVVDNLAATMTQFENYGVNLLTEPVVTGVGTFYSFSDGAGNEFALVDKKRVV